MIKHLLLLWLVLTSYFSFSQTTVSIRVASTMDDVEERVATGAIDFDSSDIELGDEHTDENDNQIVGLRFTNVEIPAGSMILSASIQFTVDETKQKDPANYVIYAEDNANPVTFATDAYSITSRVWSTDSVNWENVPAWDAEDDAGEAQMTPELKSLVQMLVNKNDWISGNAMAFFIKGEGTRCAEAYDGEAESAAIINISYIPITTATSRISATYDDVEERTATGAIDFDSSDIELGDEHTDENDNQISGLRFTNIEIPVGSIIQAAYIQFTVDETKQKDPANYVIFAEDQINPVTFTDDAYSVTSRTWSADSVKWENVPAWEAEDDAGAAQRTPDISTLVQELVSKEGWNTGNAMVFMVKGEGTRCAEAFDGEAESAAELIINYVPVAGISSMVNATYDDVEERTATGAIDFDSSDIELGDEHTDDNDNQIAGLRFTDIQLPAGAVVKNAYIQFTVDETKQKDPANYVIFAEDEINPVTFTDDAYSVTSRTWSADSVKWENVPAWEAEDDAGLAQQTPNIGSLVTALVNKEGWTPGNAMTFFIKGEGTRCAEAFDGEAESAAKLIIEYLQSEVRYVPELVSEIKDITTKVDWDFSMDIKSNFRDLDSELAFKAMMANGMDLPSSIQFSDGVISGKIDEANVFAIKVTAKSDGDSISDMFNIVVEPDITPMLTQIGTIQIATAFDEGAAEISAYDPVSKHLFVTNAEKNIIDIIDLSDPTNPTDIGDIDFSAHGGGINSVAVYDGILAAAIEADPKQNPGKVVVYNADDATELWSVTVGALPDMVIFNEDGTKILTANEGEPNGNYTNDPEGSVSIIDVETKAVSTADFTAFNGTEAELKTKGIHIFGPGATVAMDMEPEYITVKGDQAYVTCQENNAIAVVDIPSATITSIYGLGYKDHSIEGNGIDASNSSGFIDIRTWPILGVYMPDAITNIEYDGQTYLLTANEGDAREYEEGDFFYTDELEVSEIELDPSIFPNAEYLQMNENLGKLAVTSAPADTNALGQHKNLYSYGARSFSIWNATTGELVYDSGDDFERITSSLFPENFNCADDDVSLKDRSDNKGPEPEAITVGVVNDKTYAFIGLERMGGIMVYDITNPMAPEFVDYANNRDFSANPEDDFTIHGDNAPEGLIFIPASESPNGTDLIVVSNEVSGTVTVYTAGEAEAPFTLAIFHNNDGESSLLGEDITVNGIEMKGGSIGQFKSTLDSLREQASLRGYQSMMLSSGDNFLAGLTFNASTANGVYYDAIALDSLDYDAICLGNHDFDFGPDVLADFINSFETNKAPYLSANLSYENVPSLQTLANAGRIKSSTIIDKGGENIGVVGLTTPKLPIISSPGNTTVSEALIDSLQKEVNRMVSEGINKIILISHLQNIEEDIDLAAEISGVDIMIAGGGDELLANDANLGAPYDLTVVDSYPMVLKDKDGKDIYIVTTPGNYRYLGNLLVDFDAKGNVTRIYDSNPVLVVGPDDPEIKTKVMDPIEDYIGNLSTNVIATTEVDLDFRKPNLRTGETNAGNLFADGILWQAKQLYETIGTKEPQIAIQNSGGLRIEKIVPVGEIVESVTYEVAAFDNKLVILEDVTPAKLMELMDHGVAAAPTEDGRFPQIAGFKIVYDQEAVAGTKIVSITLDDGTKIVEDGMIVDGAPNVNMVTIDFTANGGDGYPFDGTTYTYLGTTTYQQAFRNYLVDGLDGLIQEQDYPATGEGRIVENDATSASIVELRNLQVYPNPANSILNISIPNLTEGVIKLFDGTGKTVLYREFYHENLIQLQVSEYINGLYFLSVQTDEGISVKKIIIKR